MRLKAKAFRQDIRGARCKVGVETIRQQWHQGLQKLAHCVGRLIRECENDRHRATGVDQRKLPDLSAVTQCVVASIRPEEVVQVADRVEVKIRIPSAELLNFLLRVDPHNI
jgi:hypothetical protein